MFNVTVQIYELQITTEDAHEAGMQSNGKYKLHVCCAYVCEDWLTQVSLFPVFIHLFIIYGHPEIMDLFLHVAVSQTVYKINV